MHVPMPLVKRLAHKAMRQLEDLRGMLESAEGSADVHEQENNVGGDQEDNV